MFRRLFQALPVDIEDTHPDRSTDAPADKQRKPVNREGEATNKTAMPIDLGKFDSFDVIYRSGPTNQPNLPYDILKVAQMLESPHIATLSAESKRGSLLMALEAAGAEAKDILQEALVRQRALSDYEELQQRKLRDFESIKGEENRVIQEELDQINAEYLARIQRNVNETAKQQDILRAWQKSKQNQLAVIAEACGYLAPIESSGNSLAAALDRAARR